MTSIPFPSRLPNVGTTIFTVMSALANQHKAINLSQGFPDFDSPARLIERVEHHMKQQHNQYPPMQGVLPLREAIAAKVSELYGVESNPATEITVTAGATQAIFTAIAACVRPGDEVIIFEPAYDSYAPAVELNGGQVVRGRLAAPDFRLPLNELANLITPRTRLILLNSPHNPTGTVATRQDLDALYNLIKDTSILVCSDEVYEHMVFDDQAHASVLAHAGLRERSFVVSSFGKTYHITGWKVGYCIAPPYLMSEFRKVHQFVVFTVNTPVQLALADFMADASWYAELRALYQDRRNFFRRCLEGSSWTLLPCAGTYFQIASHPRLEETADAAFCEMLTVDRKVAAIPVSAFYNDGRDDHFVRFCFAKHHSTLEQAAERLITLR